MNNIITETIEKLKSHFEHFFKNDDKTITDVENYFSTILHEATLTLTAAYYEKKDLELLQNKQLRKQKRLIVERRNDKRAVLTSLGLLEYRRTYYAKTGTDDNGYVYPTDEIAGINSQQRISNTMSEKLVNYAVMESYQKATDHVSNGFISKQTVMNKIRSSTPKHDVPLMKRNVPILHVDADEDHVALQTGKSTILPLISVYEGIVKSGKRSICKNVFHISEMVKDADELWENVLSRIEDIYDLKDTKIYLHGDGASWIKTGMEWLPNCQYCLDRYHANKYLKQTTSGMKKEECNFFQDALKTAIKSGEREEIHAIQGEMIYRHPECEKNILYTTEYLYNNFDGMYIYEIDKESLNGGATEPHVSHILSSRLSSRPMGWSIKTLQKLSPILATKSFIFGKEEKPQQKEIIIRKKKKIKHAMGFADPDNSFSMACNGKRTGTFKALAPYFK